MNWVVIFVAVAILGALLHFLIDLLERQERKRN